MKYVAKELRETADISRAQVSPTQILKYCLALAVICVGVYAGLGWMADAVAVRISPATEQKLAFLGSRLRTDTAGHSAQQAVAQAVLHKLLAHTELPPFQYEVFIMSASEPNALALPGGSIVLTTGLFDIVKSEEALAMVLGHELGHFQQRDHLRGLGRGILLATTLAVVFSSSEAAGLVSSLVNVAEKRHSRRQEQGADEIGLELLVRTYGHAGGATTFFEEIRHLHGDRRLIRYLATHPAPDERIDHLNGLIRREGYRIGGVTPLGRSS